MTTPKGAGEPRTFFLNEHHELGRGEKSGGGRAPQLGPIDWGARARKVSSTLLASRAVIESSADPTGKQHFFLIATPVSVPKYHTDKKTAENKPYSEVTDYSAEHSRVFRRLGMDLIDVSSEGIAVVHASPDRFDRLVSTAANLTREGIKEQARWVTIGDFAPVPAKFRVEEAWLAAMDRSDVADAIIELQPLLSRAESADVIAAIGAMLDRGKQDAITGSGTDFSGRRWFRGTIRRDVLRRISETFFSVQSLHPPFASHVSAGRRTKSSASAPPSSSVPTADELAALPTVAVVDTGCPSTHSELAPYRRGIGYRHPDAYGAFAGDHGSSVASRVVYGELNYHGGLQARPRGTCRFFDVMVARDAESIEDKAITIALDAVVATAPDVRVFNLSFGDRDPMGLQNEVELRERLLLVQDLDNFVFARDVLVVFAAGNSPFGTVPSLTYPDHVNEPSWGMGAWPSGFNSVTCGALVDTPYPHGLVRKVGWPSPFSRVGPGVAKAPKPDFAAGGGDLADDWSWRPSLGVWCCDASGNWEDKSGTSLAAPLLAREAAFAFQRLQKFCPPGSRPYGVTVKAFLALTAKREKFSSPVEELALRTIGRGIASASRLLAPQPNSAVFIWQGIIEGPNEIVRVQLPVPQAWLAQADSPSLRVVCSWDPPVNEAVRRVWACRKVGFQLRPGPGMAVLRGSVGNHPSYPLIDRIYRFSPEKLQKFAAESLTDMWTLEISYEETAEYAAGMTFSPQQRVAFAAELFDDGAVPVTPQPSVQLLPAATTMVRLGVTSVAVPTPIVIRRT